LDQALIVLDDAYKLCLEHPEGFGMMENLSIALAEAYLAMAERSSVTQRRDWLAKSKRSCDDALRLSKKAHYIRAEAYIVKGKFEMLRGNKTSAEKWWQRAIAASDEYGFLYDLGLAYLESGRQLNKRSHLEQAFKIFSEIGAQWDLEQTQKALG
jgi:tetratricopeptide (TPR) repeat protein